MAVLLWIVLWGGAARGVPHQSLAFTPPHPVQMYPQAPVASFSCRATGMALPSGAWSGMRCASHQRSRRCALGKAALPHARTSSAVCVRTPPSQNPTQCSGHLSSQACQLPKPILLNAGEMKIPYPWIPNIVEVSLLRIGNLAIACMPGEVTTMAGRRLTRALKATVGDSWGPDLQVGFVGSGQAMGGGEVQRRRPAAVALVQMAVAALGVPVHTRNTWLVAI